MTTLLRPDAPLGGFGINAYGPGYVQVNGERQSSPFLLDPHAGITPWPQASLAQLSASHFAPLVERRPEVVLIGTGERQVFLHPQILSPLINAGIGVECMSLQAACRTYNILMSEGRKVIAALLFDHHQPAAGSFDPQPAPSVSAQG